MPDQIQLRGGTAADNDGFTGVTREVTVDTTNKTLRVHDGVTSGGHPLIQGTASSAADADTLIKRDEWGRAQVADPEADADIANKGWVAGQIGGLGQIVQIVESVYSTAVEISGETMLDTGLEATITPTSADNKIVVLVHQPVYGRRDFRNMSVSCRLMRGATEILAPAIVAVLTIGGSSAVHIAMGNYSPVKWDSPATTDPVTYKTQGASSSGASSIITLQVGGGPSQMLLVEVAGA